MVRTFLWAVGISVHSIGRWLLMEYIYTLGHMKGSDQQKFICLTFGKFPYQIPARNPSIFSATSTGEFCFNTSQQVCYSAHTRMQGIHIQISRWIPVHTYCREMHYDFLQQSFRSIPSFLLLCYEPRGWYTVVILHLTHMSRSNGINLMIYAHVLKIWCKVTVSSYYSDHNAFGTTE